MKLKSSIKGTKYDLEWAARHLAIQHAVHTTDDNLRFTIGMYLASDAPSQQIAGEILFDAARNHSHGFTRDEYIAFYHQRQAELDAMIGRRQQDAEHQQAVGV